MLLGLLRNMSGGVRLRRFRVALVALTALVLASTTTGATWAGPAFQSSDDMTHLEAQSGKQFETDFMNMMIDHHQSALDMANLVPDRAAHQEIKDAAQKIIADQTREIGEMESWLQSWYGEAYTKGMMHDMPGMGMSDMTKLAGLKGDEFDKEFLTMMRTHHMGAVQMAQLVPSRATHDELKTLSGSIISSQSTEIKQFESWLKSWYNIDVTSMSGMSGMSDASPTAAPGGSMTSATPPDPIGASGTSGAGSSAPLPQTGAGSGVAEWSTAAVNLALLALLAIALGGTLLFAGALRRKSKIKRL